MTIAHLSTKIINHCLNRLRIRIKITCFKFLLQGLLFEESIKFRNVAITICLERKRTYILCQPIWAKFNSRYNKVNHAIIKLVTYILQKSNKVYKNNI